jgi:protocatechuate 3,4-dioxygenase beta subunit
MSRTPREVTFFQKPAKVTLPLLGSESMRVRMSLCLLPFLLCFTDVAARAADEEELPFHVSGTVVAADGEPVEAAEIWLRVADQRPRDKYTHDDWFEPIATRSGVDGRFEMALDREGPYRLFVLHPEHPPLGHPSEVVNGEPVQLAFAQPMGFSGRVRDAEGRSVAGARVVACSEGSVHFGVHACLAARTDAEGGFDFARLAPGVHALQAVAPGKSYSEMSRVKLPLGADVEPLTLDVGPGAEVSGTLKDDEGTPLPGVQVYHATDRVRLGHARGVRDVQPLTTTLTDDTGGFTLRGLPAETPLKAFARPNTRGTAESSTLTLDPGGALGDVVIVYQRRSSVSVHLVDRDGQPVTALQVLWKPAGEKESPGGGIRPAGSLGLATVESRGEGRFTLRHVKPGRYTITMLPDGFEEIVLERIRLSPGAEVDLGTRVVRPGVTLSGSVNDDLGDPIAGAKVEGMYLKGSKAMARTVTSDERGRFSLGGLGDSPLLRLIVTADGHAGESEQGVSTDQDDYEVVLERAGSVVGRATLEDGGNAEGLTTSLESTSGGRPTRGRPTRPVEADDEGRFEITDAAPGTYLLRLDAHWARPLRVKDIVVRPGEPTDVGTHLLESGRELSGTVLDLRDASPIAGAVIRVTAVSGAMYGTEEELGTGITNGDGDFLVGGMPDVGVELHAEHPDYASAKLTVTLKPDEPADEVTIRLGQGGSLSGTVRDEDDRLAPARSLGLASGSAGFFASENFIRTDDTGAYRVEKLSPGAYRVMLFPRPGAARRNTQTKSATIREGEETVVDFDSGETIVLSGVLTRGGRPVGEVMVLLVPDGSPDMMRTRSADVDVNGHFEIGLPGPGEYSVMVQDLKQSLGTIGGQARIVVPDEPAVSLEIALEEGAITGRVSDEDDLPIERSVVAAAPEGTPPGGVGSGSAVQVSADGSYRLDGIGEGTYDVYAAADGYEIGTMTVSLSGATEVGQIDFRLVRAVELAGRVVDSHGKGIAGALVFASPSEAVEPALGIPAETDAEGYFRVSAPSTGPCDLEAVARGHAPGRLQGFVRPAGDEGPGAVIALSPGGRLVIRVVDANGNALDGVQPVLQPDVPTQALATAFLFSPVLPTDTEGSSIAAHLPDGGYTVSLAGHPEVAPRTAAVSGAGETAVTLELP